MRITERRLREVIQSVLVENEMKKLEIKKAHMMKLFANPVNVAFILNRACGKVKPAKLTNKTYHIDDKKIAEMAMQDPKMPSYYDAEGMYDGKKSLGLEDRNKIKGALESILANCSDYKKKMCIIDQEDVESITANFVDYDHIGRTGPVR